MSIKLGQMIEFIQIRKCEEKGSPPNINPENSCHSIKPEEFSGPQELEVDQGARYLNK